MHARTPFALLALLSTSGLALGAWACNSFTDADEKPADGGASTDSPAPGDATTEDGGVPPDGGDGGDAALPVMGTLSPRCPRPGGPTLAPSVSDQRQLYVAPAGGVEQPFGLATDSAWVYWTTLSYETTGDVPYDGRGTAKIMRVDRSGAKSGAKASVIAEGQRDTRALAMAGEHLYWVAMDGSKALLRRVRRDCAANCPVFPVIQLGSTPFWDLIALGDKALLAVDGAETAWVIDLTATPPEVKITTAMADFPAVTATDTAGFVSAGSTKEVKTVPVATLIPAPLTTLTDGGAGSNLGLAPLTTDCKDLYGWRAANQIWKLGLDGGGGTSFATLSSNAVFGLVADESFLYAASPDGPGVSAVSIATGIEQTVRPGNVHRIAVDDKGVYWGDHDRNSGGGIWMMVK